MEWCSFISLALLAFRNHWFDRIVTLFAGGGDGDVDFPAPEAYNPTLRYSGELKTDLICVLAHAFHILSKASVSSIQASQGRDLQSHPTSRLPTQSIETIDVILSENYF